MQTPHLSPPPGTQLLQGQAAWCRGTGSSLHLCEANAIFTRRTGGSSGIVLHRCQPPSSEQGCAGGVTVTPQPPPSHSSRRDETPAPARSCRRGERCCQLERMLQRDSNCNKKPTLTGFFFFFSLLLPSPCLKQGRLAHRGGSRRGGCGCKRGWCRGDGHKGLGAGGAEASTLGVTTPAHCLETPQKAVGTAPPPWGHSG